MAMVLSIAWVLCLVGTAVFAFIAGKYDRKHYLLYSMACVPGMYAAVYFLGRY